MNERDQKGIASVFYSVIIRSSFLVTIMNTVKRTGLPLTNGIQSFSFPFEIDSHAYSMPLIFLAGNVLLYSTGTKSLPRVSAETVGLFSGGTVKVQKLN